MKQYRITIYGLVHGVGFRFYVREEAFQLRLTGYVRNNPDGSVFIAAEGADSALERLLSWCRKGPRSARVDRVDHTVHQAEGITDDFKVIE